MTYPNRFGGGCKAGRPQDSVVIVWITLQDVVGNPKVPILQDVQELSPVTGDFVVAIVLEKWSLCQFYPLI